MAFPLGKPLLVMLVLASASGMVLAFRPTPPRKELVYWIFAESHRKEFTPVLKPFEDANHTQVELDLIVLRAMYVRLLSMFMTKASGDVLPDCFHIEISQVGKFFRPPLDGVGMLELTPYLQNNGAREIATIDAFGQEGWNARLTSDGKIYSHDGQRWVLNPTRAKPDMWIDRVLRQRFSPWTKQGHIFGVPQDVHPLTITYREDLFREAGVDLAACATWKQFHEGCLAMQRYWKDKGVPIRHAIELEEVLADKVQILLLQRHINLVDDFDRIYLDHPKVANTVAFYASLVAGERQIATTASDDLASELDSGTICACLTPDWKILYIRDHAPRANKDAPPDMQGKLRMMALPRFDPDDAPTSTWGGTCVSIPKACPRPDLAWKLIEWLYFSDAALEQRLKAGNVLPPLKEQWNHPRLKLPDPLYGGQVINQLYVKLAYQSPQRFVTPSTSIALAQLGQVLARAVAYVRANGENGLEAQCQLWLNDAAADLKRRMERQHFDQPPAAPAAGHRP